MDCESEPLREDDPLRGKVTKTAPSLHHELESDYKKAPAIPDGGWGWAVVAASFMSNAVVDGALYSMGIFVVEWSNQFNASKSYVSWIPSLLSGFYLLIGIVVDVISSKIGLRKTVLAGSIMASLGFALSSLVNNVELLFLSIGVLGGVGFGFIYMPSIVAVAVYFEKKRAFATGLAVCGTGAGMFFMAPIVQLIVSNYGWTNGVLFLATTFCLCPVFALFYRPLPESKDAKDSLELKPVNSLIASKEENNIDELATGERHNSQTQSSTKDEKHNSKNIFDVLDFSLLKKPKFLLIAVSCFLMATGMLMPFNFIIDYAMKEGIPKYEATFLVSFMGIVNTIWRIVAGLAADKLPMKPMIINDILVMIGGISAIVLPFYSTYTGYIIFCVIFSIALATFQTLRTTIVVEIIGLELLSKGFGIMITCQGIGAIIGSPLAGWVFDVTNSYAGSFQVAGSLMFLSGFIGIPLWFCKSDVKQEEK